MYSNLQKVLTFYSQDLIIKLDMRDLTVSRWLCRKQIMFLKAIPYLR